MISLTPLTPEERLRILDRTTSMGRLIEVWEVIMARFGSSIEEEESIAPWDYALPHADAIWVCQQIINAEPNPMNKSQWALEWANRGPAYYITKKEREK